MGLYMISYSMRIGIIGAGLTGLSAALELQKKGYEVHLFEQEPIPGGLAIGFKQKNWEWPLEKHYHHIFTTDTAIRAQAERLNHSFTFSRPNTSSLIDGEILQLDSPLTLLQFKKLSIVERLRMGMVLGYLKYLADWKELEKYKAHEWLPEKLGKRGYTMIWEPLLKTKFGSYYKDISLAWFWARIKARSTELGYPEGGFQTYADVLSNKIIDQGGIIDYETSANLLEEKNKELIISYTNKKGKGQEKFDAVLLTIPNVQIQRLVPQLPQDYVTKLKKFQYIGAVNMVLELSAPMLPKDVYWLNICEDNYPFLAVVEHTNFANKSHYDNKYIVYVGKYLAHGHKYFAMNAEQLLAEYDPYLKKLNPNYKKHLLNSFIFKVPFAQPIVTQNFSKEILPFETPIKNVFLANMQQVYPWDRGTNFAVEMGERVASVISGKIEG